MATIFKFTLWMKMHALRSKLHWSMFLGVQLQYSSIGSDNGLARIRRQVSIWTKDGLGYRRIYASLEEYENFTQSRYSEKTIKQWLLVATSASHRLRLNELNRLPAYLCTHRTHRTHQFYITQSCQWKSRRAVYPWFGGFVWLINPYYMLIPGGGKSIFRVVIQ